MRTDIPGGVAETTEQSRCCFVSQSASGVQQFIGGQRAIGQPVIAITKILRLWMQSHFG